MLKEFKEFALRGNVIDLAVGIIIGGAFGKIVTSLVSDLIMPIFGYLTAGINFTSMKYVLSEAGVLAEEEVAILYGNFIQNVVDFLIIAFSIFIAIKLINKTRKKEEEAAETVEPIASEKELLTEIRDLLKEKQRP